MSAALFTTPQFVSPSAPEAQLGGISGRSTSLRVLTPCDGEASANELGNHERPPHAAQATTPSSQATAQRHSDEAERKSCITATRRARLLSTPALVCADATSLRTWSTLAILAAARRRHGAVALSRRTKAFSSYQIGVVLLFSAIVNRITAARA